MDRRSWPWKKKSSDKAAAEKSLSSIESARASLVECPDDQVSFKKPTNVQLSADAYSHFAGLEDQLKSYEDELKILEEQNRDLEEKLSTAHSEMTAKECLVKQHAKVAEEAVSGWEKVEAEALALKNQLESVTHSKLTAEDRSTHLDGALKECIWQNRKLKEEHEVKLHEVVVTKTMHWEKIKDELQSKISNMEQNLLHSAAENAALSRSLQEHSKILLQLTEEKSDAETEIEHLKNKVESREREINSFKYELHVVSKELEIRNEEKNMSMKSAEVANKNHSEGVKKISKLEAECQRLRGLVKKKLPGPAALAQMKLEVENLGRDFGEGRVKRSPPVKHHGPHFAEFSFENVNRFHRDNEFLSEQLIAMEEESKMLKEALVKRNNELQASRNICAKTTARLQTLELQMQNNNQQECSSKLNAQNPMEVSSSQHASNPPSLTSMSEDGNDDGISCAESWGTGSVSEVFQFRKDTNFSKSSKSGNAKKLELMDDFLEMEKLACLATGLNQSISDSSNNNKSEDHDLQTVEINAGKDFLPDQAHDSVQNTNQVSDSNQMSLERLQSRILVVFESSSDMGKILEDIKHIVQETLNSLIQHSVGCVFKEIHCPDASCDKKVFPEDKEISFSQDSRQGPESVQFITEELAASIAQIHHSLLYLCKEVMVFQTTSPGAELNRKIEEFSSTTNNVLSRKLSLNDFINELSHVLAMASDLGFNEEETGSSYCIDKVALPEDKSIQKDSNSMVDGYVNGCDHNSSDSILNPEVPLDSNVVMTIESNPRLFKCSFEEFEQMQLQKNNLALELARCTDELVTTKSQLQEMENVLEDVKAQLGSTLKTNSLAETQLKCMAESYKLLEMRAQELENEVGFLRAKTEMLENEFEEEKNHLQDALARCENLEEQLKRNESCPEENIIDTKTKQDQNLKAAAEKLAECQETILVLGRQLKGFRSSTEEEDEMVDSSNLQTQGAGDESPSAHLSLSENESNHPLRSPLRSVISMHRPTKSGSSFPPSTPEKQSRGFTRFFSSNRRMTH